MFDLRFLPRRRLSFGGFFVFVYFCVFVGFFLFLGRNDISPTCGGTEAGNKANKSNKIMKKVPSIVTF